MKVMSSSDFYALPEVERIAMIGEVFKEVGRETLYFPVGLTSDQFNYGISQGLVFVIPVLKATEGKWFRVGVESPDDMDIDLDFGPGEISVRQDVIEFLRRADKRRVTYLDLLLAIQKQFGGTIAT